MIRLMEDQTVEEKEKGDIDKEMRFLWLVWATQVGMLLALVIICHVFGARIREKINLGEDFPLGIMQIAFGITSVFSLGFAHYLRKCYLGGKFKQFQDICVQVAAARNMAPTTPEGRFWTAALASNFSLGLITIRSSG